MTSDRPQTTPCAECQTPVYCADYSCRLRDDAEDLVSVPREPTEEMHQAAYAASDMAEVDIEIDAMFREATTRMWQAMVAAWEQKQGGSVN